MASWRESSDAQNRMTTSSLLAINSGSSSLRFALYAQDAALTCLLQGFVERIGLSGSRLEARDGADTLIHSHDLPHADHAAAIAALLDVLEQESASAGLTAIGHRLVHGMPMAQPQRISASLLDPLRRAQALAPGHLPGALAAIDALGEALPALPQIACFDCDFHDTMPRRASLLPIPRQYRELGLRRYGFHGLSYAWLMQELTRIGDPAAQQGRVILAHLGNGASLAAVHDGRSIDTTMGLTPASGIVMGSRSGDLDPMLATHLAHSANMDAEQFQRMVNHQSGLLGISGISPDMRDLLQAQSSSTAAADAVDVFCYQVRKSVGAYAAALGGLDTLVFSGGIGEHAPEIRARSCAGLEFLGIALDADANARSLGLISRPGSAVRVRVIPTDEARMIARLTQRACADP
jgi:acetate kinase